MEGSGAPSRVTRGLGSNSTEQTNAMSLWRAREGVRMGNALASDGARIVHFILLPGPGSRSVGCRQPT